MYVDTAIEGVTAVENDLGKHQIHYLKTVDVRAGEQLSYMPEVPSAIAQSMVKSVQPPFSCCLPMVASSKLLHL